jgi:hypothetical protein
VFSVFGKRIVLYFKLLLVRILSHVCIASGC